MAHISERKNKNGKVTGYKVEVYLGRDAHGKQIKPSTTIPIPQCKNKREIDKAVQHAALEFEEKVKKDYNIGVTVNDKRQSFKSFVTDVFFPLHVDGNTSLSPTTRDYYYYTSKRALAFFGDKELAKISTIDINLYLRSLQSEKQSNGKYLSDKTIKHHKVTISTIFDYAKRNHLIDYNPVDDCETVSVRRKKITYLTAEEAIRFFEVVDKECDIQHKCMVEFMLYYGIRRGELCALQWQDIDWQNKTFMVQRNVTRSKSGGTVVGVTKTDESLRQLSLEESIMADLKAWHEEQQAIFAPAKLTGDSFIFSSPLSLWSPLNPQGVTKYLSRFASRYGFNHLSPHLLRHTVATLMHKEGAQDTTIQHTLGHTDIRTTMEYYIGKDAETLREESNAYIKTLRNK